MMRAVPVLDRGQRAWDKTGRQGRRLVNVDDYLSTSRKAQVLRVLNVIIVNGAEGAGTGGGVSSTRVQSNADDDPQQPRGERGWTKEAQVKDREGAQRLSALAASGFCSTSQWSRRKSKFRSSKGGWYCVIHRLVSVRPTVISRIGVAFAGALDGWSFGSCVRRPMGGGSKTQEQRRSALLTRSQFRLKRRQQ